MGVHSRSIRWIQAAVAVLVALCLNLSGVDYYTEEFAAGLSRIRVKGTDPAIVRNLGFYCSRASRLVDKVLRASGAPKRKLQVLELVEGGDPGDKDPDAACQVLFRLQEDELGFTHSVFRQLLRRRIQPLCKLKLVDKPFLSLVTAGLCYRFVRGRHSLSGYYEPDYEVARNQFMRKDYPNLRTLLETDISQEQRYLYELYMMHSDLLLLVLESLNTTSDSLVLALLAAEQNGEDVYGTLENLSRPFRGGSETLQSFYERMVFKVSRRRRRLSGEDVIAERVRELETVPVVGMEDGSALKRVPLEEVPDVLKDYRKDIQGVLRLESKFLELREASPYLLRESLQKYAVALSRIREGNERRFKTEIREARKQFKSAMERQRRMNRMFDEYEQEHVPALKRFMDYVLISRYYRTLADRLYPAGWFIGTSAQEGTHAPADGIQRKQRK